MQQLLFGIVILFGILSGVLAVRLGMYRSQLRHMREELSMLLQEDTNYRLSSCCRVGDTEEIVTLFNQIVEKYRSETVALKNENRSYRESITSISHDIRTPLTSAKGYLQMLSKGLVPSEKQQVYLATVEHRVDDVTQMLNQLFEYARVEAGELAFEMEMVNLTNLFEDTISLFYEDFVRKDCEPVIETLEKSCYVCADRHAVTRIIENLIKNALVHGTDDYRLCLREEGGQVHLSVSNRTNSIEQKDMERIFDRFYTTDTSRTRKTTGLGLAIVKQFTDCMHGSVRASLEENLFSVEVTFDCVGDE